MTVKQLIGQLERLDPEQMVVANGYEGGYDEILAAVPIRLKLHAHTDWWYGKHEQDDNGECLAIHIK
jgi:hypothetical protein